MKLLASIAIACSALTLSPTFAADVMVGGQPMMPNKTIVANAVNSADHTTLVAAVKAAGLVDTLQGKGPFTVFAPTNAAFNKLPAGTVDTLVKPENKATLTKILTYHVVPGRVLKADVPINTPIRTVQGQTFSIDAMLRITDQRGRMASIVATDVFTSNGVIHVIDKVILPAA